MHFLLRLFNPTLTSLWESYCNAAAWVLTRHHTVCETCCWRKASGRCSIPRRSGSWGHVANLDDSHRLANHASETSWFCSSGMTHMTPAGDIRCFSHFSHLFPMQMTMAAAAFSCWTGTGCNCVSQPFLAQAQGKNSACFPETAVIMVARQRFQMFESVQFHLQDHLGIVLKPSYSNFVCRLVENFEV